MNKSINESELLTVCQELLKNDKRSFLAIAGAPGSGKSTVAERLLNALNQSEHSLTANPLAAILPMDGYHYDDAILQARGRLPWKGAPDTFDASGLRSTLARLSDPTESELAVPVFDRDLELSRGSARIIPQSVKLVLVEGNYLLLDKPPWSALHPWFDTSVMIDVSEAELSRRLRNRWINYGLNETQIASKLDNNDMPNGRLIREQSIEADYRLST